MSTTKPEEQTTAAAQHSNESLAEKCHVEIPHHTSPSVGYVEAGHEPHHPLPESARHQANHSTEEIKAYNYSHHPQAYTDGSQSHHKDDKKK